MIKLKELLNELIVTDLSSSKNNTKDYKYFIVYKSKLFLLDDGSKLNKIKKFMKSHPSLKNNRYDPFEIDDKTDIYQVLYAISDITPDILSGIWYPNKKEIHIMGDEVNPVSSLNVKKLVKQLGIEKISYQRYSSVTQDAEDRTISAKKLQGNIPKTVFHGTSTNELKSILTYGLDPGRGTSKFIGRGVQHSEHIFFTATFEEAEYYSGNAVYHSKSKYGNYPVIIELKVPDLSLLVPDYDADISTTTKRQFPIFIKEPDAKSDMKSMGISRESGKWGYKGRIPASFIQWIYYFQPINKKWRKSRPDIWRKLLSKYDWDTLEYKLGIIKL